jgi:NTE family protein
MVSEINRRGLVLGCGGTLGAAWSIATLFEVARALDWDPREAEVIVGTSAGSELATLIGSGVSVETLLDAQLGRPSADAFLARYFARPIAKLPPLPHAQLGSPRLLLDRTLSPITALAGLAPIGRGDPSFLDGLVDRCAPNGGWVPHRHTKIVAVDYDSGARVAFDGGISLKKAVRASWAIPGWFPPVEIDGRRFVDGGIASPASADLLLGHRIDEAIVLAPMSSSEQGPRTGLGRVEGAAREQMRRTLDREIELLRRSGIRVLRLEPTAEDLAVMGPNFMDGARRLRTLEHALRSARRNVRASLSSLSTEDRRPKTEDPKRQEQPLR